MPVLDNHSKLGGPNRVVFFGFRRPLNQQALTGALEKRRPERVCLVSRSDFLGPLKDEFLSARNGFRACTFEANRFQAFPPGPFLEAMRDHEVVALRMYERIFRGAYSGQSHRKRRALYLQHVAYAYGLLVDGGYESVVFSEIPHHPFAYVLHSVARLLDLDVRFFAQFQVKDSYVVASGIPEMFQSFGTELTRMSTTDGREELQEQMRTEVARRTEKHQPFYMGTSDLTPIRRLYMWSKRFFRADDRLRTIRAVRNALAYKSARRPEPTAAEPFIYFPLHLQPEATTSPMGGVYVDQYLALETLVRALPPGWKIVVKENPAQRFAKRDLGFYEHLGSLGAVHLVSRKVDTFGLIERCEAIATITGTAGWEALFKNKPAIVFGYAFYRDAPGVIAVESVEDLTAELRRVADGNFEVATQEQLVNFLCAVQQHSFHGVVDTAYLRDSELSFDEAVDRYTTVLSNLLEGQGLLRSGT
jgi:hypothetical protein